MAKTSKQLVEQTDWADLNMKAAIAMALIIIAALLTYLAFFR